MASRREKRTFVNTFFLLTPVNTTVVGSVNNLQRFIDSFSQEERVVTGWETVHCNKGTFFLCQDQNFPEDYFF